MLGVKGAIVEESLMLVHAHVGGNVVVLAPSAKRVQKKDGVFKAKLKELLTSVLEQKNVTIVEWVSHLECVNSISALGLNLGLDLSGRESEVVDTIAEGQSLEEAHAGT